MTEPGYAILHADAFLLVADKASGLLSVPGIGPEKADCLVARLQGAYPGARIVHRLDRDTSGVMVLARDADTHRTLSMAFEARAVEKSYEALVAGHLATARGTIDLPLRKEALGSARQIVHPTEGKPSVTDFAVLERGRDADGFAWTRVRLEPKTGRSHQLRVHMLAIGHPILGDELYGAEVERAGFDRAGFEGAGFEGAGFEGSQVDGVEPGGDTRFSNQRARPRLCLHARTLSFLHPGTQQRVSFDAPCPF